MTEANATMANDTETAAKLARIAELKRKIGEGTIQNGIEWMDSAEAQAMFSELSNLQRGKKAKAAKDPVLTEEEKGLREWLFGAEGEENGGQQGSATEKLNAKLAEKFPHLKEKGVKVEVKIKLTGLGRGSGDADRAGYARIVMLTKEGKRDNGFYPQALPSIKILREKLSKADFGMIEAAGLLDGPTREKFYTESGKDTKKTYVELSTGQKIGLQSK